MKHDRDTTTPSLGTSKYTGARPDILHPFIYAYADTYAKQYILENKKCKFSASTAIADSIYTYICTSAKLSPYITSFRCARHLITHAPSTSFALGKKPHDHGALILQSLHRTYQRTANTLFTIDISIHMFMIYPEYRQEQHTLSRQDRIHISSEKFSFVMRPPILLLAQYDLIYIIDDVTTTGHTLESLRHVLLEFISPYTHTSPTIQIRTLAYAH